MEQTTQPDILVMKPQSFRARTILIPLLFVGMHFVMSFLILMVFFGFAYFNELTVRGFSQSQSDIMALLNAAFTSVLQNQTIIVTILAACLIPICLVFLKLNAKRDARILMNEKMRLVDLLPALAMMLGTLGVVNLWFELMEYLRSMVPFVDKLMSDYQGTSDALSPAVGFFWQILGISILVPIAEELIFRGIVQGELRKAMPAWAAIVIQGVVFGLYHMQPIQSTYAILAGLVLGLAYHWSRSILVPIAMHCLFNFFGGALPYMLDERSNSILSMAEIAFIMVAVIAFFFLKSNRRKEIQYRTE